VYDALSSDRPYRAAMPADECFQMLRADADGGGVDPTLVRSFVQRTTTKPVVYSIPADAVHSS